MGRVPEPRKVNRCQKYLEASRGTVSAGSVSAAVPRCYLDCRTSLVTVSLQSCVETGRSLVSEDSKGTRSCRMHAATQTKSCRHVVATVQAPPQTLSQTGLAPMQYILHRYGRRSPVTESPHWRSDRREVRPASGQGNTSTLWFKVLQDPSSFRPTAGSITRMWSTKVCASQGALSLSPFLPPLPQSLPPSLRLSLSLSVSLSLSPPLSPSLSLSRSLSRSLTHTLSLPRTESSEKKPTI